MPRAVAVAALVVLAGGLVGASAACTFLITFDDVPSADAGDEAPPDSAPSAPPSTASTSPPPPPPPAPDASAPAPITPPCDATFPLKEVQGCASYVEGAQICADSTSLTSYPGDRTHDLVTCSKEGATCVRHCAACAHLPNGYPDQCDACSDKTDGTYCGTDMGWQPVHFKLLATCTGGRVASASACANGCDSQGGTGTAKCK